MFKPTYLYVKTHRTTGLKYFGKTVQNPLKYPGSGLVWTAHLKKHGNDVETEIIGYFIDEYECRAAAIEFSIRHDIIHSKQWANLKNETLDGGWTRDQALNGIESCRRKSIGIFKPGFYDELSIKNGGGNHYLNKMSDSAKKEFIEAHLLGKNNPNSGREYSSEERQRISERTLGEKNPFFGKKHSEETRRLMRQNGKGKGSGSKNVNAKSVTINGITYGSHVEAMKALNVSRFLLSKLIKENK